VGWLLRENKEGKESKYFKNLKYRDTKSSRERKEGEREREKEKKRKE
jgi:hypothetical protein